MLPTISLLWLVLTATRQGTVAPPAPLVAPDPRHVAETVVVTATVAPEPAGTVARDVTVLTRADLEVLGVSSVIDALRLAPAMDVQARGPLDVQTDFSIRASTFGQSLMLVDGNRVNDSQTGHHDGDIPIALAGLDRIEIVNGAGSAAHGADALGGTVNFITRADPHVEGSLSTGEFGYAAAQVSLTGVVVPKTMTLTGWFSRSDGFTFDREFAQGGGAVQTRFARGWTLDLRHERKAFGADDFYGESPSKEWTDQTIAALGWTATRGAWTTDVHLLGRDHGDHFRWDINQPGFAENEHRTNAGALSASVSRVGDGGTRVTVGAEGGDDWVRSSNLGDHGYAHASAFAELLAPLGSRVTAQAGLRVETFSTFGTAVSPSAALSARAGSHLKLRTSAAHAFRIPTFTELYYHDPADLGTPTLRPEHGWSIDAGADWTAGSWTASVSPFARWDRDVIDWVRATPDDLWQATNVRAVTTTGVEVSVTRRWHAALVRASFTNQDVSAPALDVLSKYVLAYARRSAGLSLGLPLVARVHVSLTADYRDRYDGQRYTLVGLRAGRDVGRAEVFVEGSNLLDAQYTEIAGVAMPGRWLMTGMTFR